MATRTAPIFHGFPRKVQITSRSFPPSLTPWPRGRIAMAHAEKKQKTEIDDAKDAGDTVNVVVVGYGFAGKSFHCYLVAAQAHARTRPYSS